MGFETLGGHKNAHETKRPTDVRMESEQDRLDFTERKQLFARQAVSIFQTDNDFMRELRTLPLFQSLKNERSLNNPAGFDDSTDFETLAAHLPEMRERFQLEDVEDQAALLAMIMRTDMIQDDDMRKQVALEAA